MFGTLVYTCRVTGGGPQLSLGSCFETFATVRYSAYGVGRKVPEASLLENSKQMLERLVQLLQCDTNLTIATGATTSQP